MKADNIIKELKTTGILLFMVLAAAALYMGSIAQAAEPAQLRTIAFAVISVWVCAGIIICLRINSRSKDDGCWSQKDLALLESWYRRCIVFCLIFSAAGMLFLALLFTDQSNPGLVFLSVPCYLMGISAGAVAGCLRSLFLKKSPLCSEGKRTL